MLFGSELSPIRLRLRQGVRLSAVEDELRRTHDSQNAAAAGLAGAILAIFGLTAAGFSRRQAALERRQADRLERATQAGQVGLWDYNPRTGLFEWNEEWSRILGAFPDEFQRRPQALLDLVHPDDRASVLSQIGELAGKTTIGAMFRIVRPDGGVRMISIQGALRRDDEGKLLQLSGTGTDITERHAAEADLRQFKSTLDATHDCVFLFWEDTLEFFYVNDGACRMMGFTASELLAMHPYDLKPEYPRPKFLELIAPLLEGRQSSLRLETVHRHKDGHDIPVEIFLQKVAPPNERARFVNIVTDTTARREARAALALTNQRMQLAIDAASIGVWEWDLRTNQIQWDRRMFELYDAPPTPDGIVGYATWHDAVHPEEVAAQEAYMQEVVEGRKPIGRRQFRIIRPGGSAIRHIEAAEVLVRDENGIAVKLLGTNLDITDRMEAEQNRQAHIRTLVSMDQINRVIQRTADPEQMPRRVLESVLALFPCDGVSLIHPCEPAGGAWGVAVDVCGADVPAGPKPSTALPITAELGEIFRLAQAHRRTVMQAGPESGTALPEPFREVFGAESCMLIRIDPEGGAGWILMIRSCAAAHVWSQDEERILLEVASRLEGALSGLLLFRQVLDLNSSLEGRVQDRTAELARSNEELRRSNDDLERFAFAASHDLKSPLKAVASLASWIEEDLGESLTGESREHFVLLRQRVSRMERLLDDLLLYSRAGRIRESIGEVGVATLIGDAVDLVHVPAGFEVRLNPLSIPRVTTAITPVRTMLTNLISNAVKHHDREAGVIEVTVERVGGQYRFSVADDGPGIPDEFHGRIWEMFQTLRPRDQVEGSGMGLAMVRRLAVHYGGSATVENRQPRGSTFRIALPVNLSDQFFPDNDTTSRQVR